jgi:hypothetical protein
VHPTLGSLARFQAFIYASAFFQSDGVLPPAPARVTQTVSPSFKPQEKIMSAKNHSGLTKTAKSFMPSIKNWLMWVGIAIGISSLVISAIFWNREYIAKQKQAQLAIEYKKIVPFPNSSVVKYDTLHKADEAFVGASYLLLTDTNIPDIFNYYGEKLRQEGWQHHKPAGDLQVNTMYYCKDDYLAEFYYQGNFEGNDGWTYRFDMNWSLQGCEITADEGGLLHLTQ